MARGIARVTVVGNLTRDPELKETAAGTSLCKLGVAVNSARKGQNGEWTEEVSFFDAVVWGNQGENCARYLSKGREVAIDGRLNQRRWEAEDGSRRSKVEIVANQVVFMSGGAEGSGGGGSGGGGSGGGGSGGGGSGGGGSGGSGSGVGGSGGGGSGGGGGQKSDSDLSPTDDFKDINFGDEDDIPF